MHKGIAILGGSFDPIHLGHIQVALAIQHHFHFQKILFIPCGQNVLKAKLQTTTNHRLNMLKLALKSYPDFSIDERELYKNEPSFTISTLESLRQEYPKNEPICWILGEDAYQQFDQWHRYQDILKLAHLIIVARPEQKKTGHATLQRLEEIHLTSQIDDLRRYPHGKIYFYPLSNFPYSSTVIRQNIAKGEKNFGLDENVSQYIAKHHCYQKNVKDFNCD